MSTELSADEIDRRYNHWDDNDMSRCKLCGSFVTDPEVDGQKAHYYCNVCDRPVMEWIG